MDINTNNFTKDEYDYLKRIQTLPKLNKEEKLLLIEKAQNNDKLSKDKLILHHLYLVLPVANKYSKNYNISFFDLLSIGTIGLINSIENYNPIYNVDFSNYANWYIKQEINRYVSSSLKHISTPGNKIIIIRKIKKYYKEYIKKYNKTPSPEEISKIFNLEVEKVIILLRLINDLTSLEEIINLDDINSSFEEEIIEKIYLENIIEIINSIPNIKKRDLQIVYERYGLTDGKEKTLEEVGKIFNLSKERINQIIRVVLGKIRRYILAYTNNEPKKQKLK